MAGTAVLGRLTWQVATVAAVRPESATARTLVLDVGNWPGHLAGQHVDVRLTAEDGYSAQRSYSIATGAEPAERPDNAGAEPDSTSIELTVDLLPDGEVSSYLTEIVEVGDQFEVRGPLGGWFVWRPADPGPVLLLGGGTGLVPLMSMLRTRAVAGTEQPFRLVYSTRSPAHELYAGDPAFDTVVVDRIYTRTAPDGFARAPGRIGADDLAVAGWTADAAPRVYVCGPNGFVEAATSLLLTLGHRPDAIRTERFGATGVRA
ncbi:MAG TPA: FAD-binding oxidoreductase [Aldersonia sp.]